MSEAGMEAYTVAYWDAPLGIFHHRVVWAADGEDAKREVRNQVAPSHWRLRSIRERDSGEVIIMEDALPGIAPPRPTQKRRPRGGAL